MDELERLQKENRLLKDKIQKLEETLSIVADMNKSNEIGVYIKCQQRMISLMQLVNNTSENTKVNVLAQQEKLKRAEEEKTVLDAKILNVTGICMQKMQENQGYVENVTPEEEFTYNDVGMNVEIASYIGKSDAEIVRIPQVVQGRKVVGIGSRAFRGKNVGKICLPATVRYINEKAFIGCDKLKEADLPDELENLGEYCFSLTGLEQISIPSGITKIPQYCFSECAKLKNVTLNEGLKHIGRYAFAGTSIEELTIPASVSLVENGAFSGNHSIQHKVYANCLGNPVFLGVQNEVIIKR